MAGDARSGGRARWIGQSDRACRQARAPVVVDERPVDDNPRAQQRGQVDGLAGDELGDGALAVAQDVPVAVAVQAERHEREGAGRGGRWAGGHREPARARHDRPLVVARQDGPEQVGDAVVSDRGRRRAPVHELRRPIDALRPELARAQRGRVDPRARVTALAPGGHDQFSRSAGEHDIDQGAAERGVDRSIGVPERLARPERGGAEHAALWVDPRRVDRAAAIRRDRRAPLWPPDIVLAERGIWPPHEAAGGQPGGVDPGAAVARVLPCRVKVSSRRRDEARRPLVASRRMAERRAGRPDAIGRAPAVVDIRRAAAMIRPGDVGIAPEVRRQPRLRLSDHGKDRIDVVDRRPRAGRSLAQPMGDERGRGALLDPDDVHVALRGDREPRVPALDPVRGDRALRQRPDAARRSSRVGDLDRPACDGPGQPNRVKPARAIAGEAGAVGKGAHLAARFDHDGKRPAIVLCASRRGRTAGR